MSTVELTRLSSKGQIVLPQAIREELKLEEGETLAVTCNKDMILLKRIAVPSPNEMFEKLHSWGVEFAKKKELKESDVQESIKRIRGK